MEKKESSMENLGLVDINFWKNKNVFITGHTGFKGSWLSLILHILGSNVYGYALKPPTKSLYNYLKLNEKIKYSYFGDIRNKTSLGNFINKNEFSVIIHMAAQPLVIESYKNVDNTISTNVNGTINLIELLNKLKKKFIFLNITTDKVYEPHLKFKLNNENNKLFGKDPYSCSKVLSDLLTQSYNHFDTNNKKKYLVARSGNVIGGGDFSNFRIIPDIFNSIKNDSYLKIRSPDAIRPWQHVLDPLTGYLRLIEEFYFKNIDENYSWNFGPNKSSYINVKDLVNKVQMYCNYDLKIQFINNQKFQETEYLGLDSSKAKKNINWKPNWGIDQAIKNTVSWYENFHSQKTNTFEYTRQQILNYYKFKFANTGY